MLPKEHDDKHDNCEMGRTALCYAGRAVSMILNPEIPYNLGDDYIKPDWPWDEKWWKSSADPIRNLVKGGALIAAEIDLQRRKEQKANV